MDNVAGSVDLDDLMTRIESLALDAGASRVTGVTIWLGAHSGVSPHHLRDAFLRASGDSCAAGASLRISRSADTRDPEAETIRLLGIEIE